MNVGAWLARLVPGLLIPPLLAGCATYRACQARFNGPDYTVTREFFARTPQRVAILPFAPRALKGRNLEKAQVCRVAFYQHFSVRDFEDVEMQALDRQLVPDDQSRPNGLLQQFAETVSWLDVVGLTSFLDWRALLGREDRDTSTFRDWVRTAYEDLQADAYVLGVVRGYGRLYAVVLSSLGIATHVEMRSTRDDALLWSADCKSRNISLPLTINPLALPSALFGVWRNSRGEALDILAYKVYRDVVQSVPPTRSEGQVYIQARRSGIRQFAQPTAWAFWPRPRLPAGARLPFLLERRGWYQGEGPDGRPRWVMKCDADLTDADGRPLPAADPVAGLWKDGP